jgi:hypothetical protein
LDPTAALDRGKRILSRFRACRYTEVAAKKFDSARCGAVFQEGHLLMPQPRHVKAAASRSRSLIRGDGGSIGMTSSRTRLLAVASRIRRRRESICDPETGKIVAVIRDGEVFRDDREGAKIATVLGTYVYDLNGNLVGHLQGRNVTDATTRSLPIAFRKLFEGKFS